MVSVDVDDHNVVELALVRLLAGMGQQPGGVEFIDRYPPTAIRNDVHRLPPPSQKFSARSSSATCRDRTRRDWRSAAIRWRWPSRRWAKSNAACEAHIAGRDRAAQ